MRYYNAVEEGWRADGWYEISGSVDERLSILKQLLND